eukprot:364015-Pelagomonas_calceolata.AAC.5
MHPCMACSNTGKSNRCCMDWLLALHGLQQNRENRCCMDLLFPQFDLPWARKRCTSAQHTNARIGKEGRGARTFETNC